MRTYGQTDTMKLIVPFFTVLRTRQKMATTPPRFIGLYFNVNISRKPRFSQYRLKYLDCPNQGITSVVTVYSISIVCDVYPEQSAVGVVTSSFSLTLLWTNVLYRGSGEHIFSI
jgi:hypothetical protein